MKKIYILACILGFYSCITSNDLSSELLILDSNNEVYITILEKKYMMQGEKFYHPTKIEIELVEKLLVEELNKFKSQLVREYHFFNETETPLPLNQYKRQYFPSISETDGKKIFFKCICIESIKFYEDWKSQEYVTFGGGDCFL